MCSAQEEIEKTHSIYAFAFGHLPRGRYQVAYSISPDNSSYAMDVCAIKKKHNQYEIHANFVVGASGLKGKEYRR